MADSKVSPVVVLLRQGHQPVDPYEEALRAAGCAVHFVPVLQFEFINTDELSAAMLEPDKYSGLVLTSQTAVDAIQKASIPTLEQIWKDRLVFVVGKSTRESAQKLGLESIGYESGNADALSDFIIAYFREHQVKDRPLLFPCSNLRKDTLPNRLKEAGIGLDCLVCYKTAAHSSIETNLLDLARQKILTEGTHIVFFSPSGVKYTQAFFQSHSLTSQLNFIAIGPSTAEAMVKSGITDLQVAVKPNPESIVNIFLKEDLRDRNQEDKSVFHQQQEILATKEEFTRLDCVNIANLNHPCLQDIKWKIYTFGVRPVASKMIHFIFEIFHVLMCCVECAKEMDERQAEEDRVRLAREAEIRRTNQLFRQERLKQQRRCQQQSGRIHAGTIVDIRGSVFPQESRLKPDPVPATLPSFTHSQRAPPRSRAPPVARRRRPAVDREDEDDDAEDTTEFTPLI